jgi:hypothetical protein
VRRRRERNICFGFVKTQAARSKLFASLISGMFLATVTAICMLSSQSLTPDHTATPIPPR